MADRRKYLFLARALCTKYRLDTNDFSEEIEKGDMKSLSISILKAASKKRVQFEVVPYQVLLQQGEESNDCRMASLTTNVGTFRKSLIHARNSHIIKFDDLSELTSKHENLLYVEQIVMDYVGDKYLVSEEVEPLEEYFARRMRELSPTSSEDWWKKIYVEYWVIFRDVHHGLMWLFFTGKACGQLAFNSYVTKNGRGRILLSMDLASPKDDLEELGRLMKHMLTLPPFEGDVDQFTFLPSDLKSFFHHVTKVELLLRVMPSIFVADHPYFWNTSEKFAFALKLRKFVKKSPVINSAVENELESIGKMDAPHAMRSKADDDPYEFWSDILVGVYKEIWNFSLSGMVAEYKKRVDLVRYFGAVLVHINDDSYEIARQYMELLDEEILRDLMNYYPKYFTHMHRCVCNLALKRIKGISSMDLEKLTSVYYGFTEHLKAMRK